MFLSVGIYALRHLDNFNFINSWIGNINQGSEDDQMDNLSSLNELIFKKNTSDSSCVITSGYNSLSGIYEKKFYILIKSNIENITNEKYRNSDNYVISPINISGVKLTTSQIKKVIYAFQYDNPEVFWLSNVFNYTHTNKGTTIKLNSIFSRAENEKA